MNYIDLNLVPEDIEIYSDALADYHDTCTEGKKPVVKLVMKRIKEDNPRFDGMYLRAMEEALALRSTKDSKNKDRYLEKKQQLQKKREQFQFSAMKRLFVPA
jgi:hypothetical protein